MVLLRLAGRYRWRGPMLFAVYIVVAFGLSFALLYGLGTRLSWLFLYTENPRAIQYALGVLLPIVSPIIELLALWLVWSGLRALLRRGRCGAAAPGGH